MKQAITLASVLTLLAFGPGAFLDSRAADGQSKYPLQTCVVSGEKLDSMGKPYVFTHEGKEVQLCCKGCLKDFKKESAKYTKKID